MNRRLKPPQRRPQNPAYRQAFERLDEALEREPEISPEEKIRQIYGLAPGVSGEWQPSGTVILPK
jgi:hypothetical protein